VNRNAGSQKFKNGLLRFVKVLPRKPIPSFKDQNGIRGKFASFGKTDEFC